MRTAPKFQGLRAGPERWNSCAHLWEMSAARHRRAFGALRIGVYDARFRTSGLDFRVWGLAPAKA